MWFPIILSVVGSIVIYNYFCKKTIVYNYEKGLLYKKGNFIKILDTGLYRIFRSTSVIKKVDIRTRFITVPGQELLSADSITLKVSLTAQFEIADPVIALTKVENYQEAFYLILQIALRETVGAAAIDDILQNRKALLPKLLELSQDKARAIGINLMDVNIKDIMFPGELKKIFAQELEARKEGLAALEKARGETAALRNLANAAKMVQENPALLQLRALEKTGNTIVFGLASPVIPVKKTEAGGTPTSPSSN